MSGCFSAEDDNQSMSDKEKVPEQARSFEEWRRYHYETEKALIAKIMAMPAEAPERGRVFREAYDVIIRDIIQKYNPGGGETCYSDVVVGIAKKLLAGNSRVLDIGCGSGETVFQFLRAGYSAWGIDVEDDCICRARAKLALLNAESHVARTDVLDYAPEGKFDFLLMDNVIEHLLPDTVPTILRRCFELLNPNGYLLVVTPHRFSGPHDISKYFLPLGAKAEGSHLQEYTFADLSEMLQNAGFSHRAGFPFHPKLFRALHYFPRSSDWAARKSLCMEQLLKDRRILKLNRRLTQLMVALLFPAVCLGQKR